MILGVENQAKIHYAMPVRAMLYDSMQYASQIAIKSKENRKNKKCSNSDEFLSGFTKEDRLIPVITLVVYFGSREWNGPTNLKEMFIDCDKLVARYIQNYKINMIFPQLPDRKLKKLSSELGVVIRFIKNSNNKKKLMDNLENDKKFHSVSNVSAALINEATGLNLRINPKKERINMCQAIKEMIEDARREDQKIIKAEKEKTKAEKEKTKAALKEIERLKAEVRKLQSKLKTA